MAGLPLVVYKDGSVSVVSPPIGAEICRSICGPGFGVLPRGQFVENARQTLGRQVLVIIGIDLHHRRVDAGAEALDLGPGERAIGGDVVLVTDHAVQDGLQLPRAAQHARRGAAELHVKAADRRQIEHGVEGRHFEHADFRHAEHVGDRLDRLLRQPAAGLLLRTPQKRNRPPTAGGPADIWPICAFAQSRFSGVNAKARRLLFGKAADTHRSTSPNTMSIEPKIADTSASMWPRERKSIACRCAKLGARILHLYGLLLPSAIR